MTTNVFSVCVDLPLPDISYTEFYTMWSSWLCFFTQYDFFIRFIPVSTVNTVIMCQYLISFYLPKWQSIVLLFWCWGSNSGPRACSLSALPLSWVPNPTSLTLAPADFLTLLEYFNSVYLYTMCANTHTINVILIFSFTLPCQIFF